MAYTTIFMFVILVTIELSSVNLNYTSNPDDLEKETLSYKTMKKEKKSAIYVQQLNKIYSDSFTEPKEAVKSISFEAIYNSCFVILGTNGAGKSSLFKCMTGEISATKGTVYVDGHSISHEQSFARQLIG